MNQIEVLQESNDALLQRFKQEKDIHEKEIEQVSGSYQDKFIQMKERETLLEL